MSDTDWEDRYRKALDQRNELQQRCNDQEVTIRRINTRLAQIENNIAAKQRLESSGQRGTSQPRNRENEQLIEDLFKRNNDLMKKNQELMRGKKKLAAELEKKKRELARKHAGRARSVTAPGKRKASEAASESEAEIKSVTQLNKLVAQLRTHLQNAETMRDKLKQENARLRGLSKDATAHPTAAMQELATAAAMAGERISIGSENEEILALQREVRESHARYQLLQTRYEHVEAKMKAHLELHGGSFEHMEELNKQVRDLRRALEQATEDKEIAEERSAQATDLMDRVRELEQSNREREDEIQRLCQSPFISEAYENQERMRRLQSAEERERQQKLQISHLRETAQTYHNALTQLQNKANALMAEKEVAVRELGALRIKIRESETNSELLNAVPASFSLIYGEDVNPVELEKALALIRRRHENPTAISFLETGEEEEDTIPSLRRRLQELQVRNLELQREVERTERMLKAQTKINRELHVEVEEVSKTTNASRMELQVQLAEAESERDRGKHRIQMLEAQVKQHLYSLQHGAKSVGPALALPMDEEDQSMADTAYAADLAADIGPDENIVEVWIRKVELKEGCLEESSSTFCIVDFYDFESVATPIMTGLQPTFDFATTYKVSLDDFFLRYLATESLVVELNLTKHGADFDIMARAQIPLGSMLEAYRPVLVLSHEPLYSLRSGTIQGHAHVEVRLAVPVVELYRMFLQNHPEERASIEEVVRNRVSKLKLEDGADQASEAALLNNELKVTIVKIEDVPKRIGKGGNPDPYVHYKLLGFGDTFTDIARGVRSHRFNETHAFGVVTDQRLLRLLKSEVLEFTVLDDVSNEVGGPSDPAPSLAAKRFRTLPGTIQEALKALILDEGRLTEMFEELDEDSSGAVTTEDFVSVLGRAKFAGSQSDLDVVAEAFDLGGDHTVEYREFVQALHSAIGSEVDDEDALLGEVSVPLSPLADGDPVHQELELSDGGSIQIHIEWARPLLGNAAKLPNALSGAEVEALLEKFSPVKDGRVDYFSLRDFIDPPPTIHRCLERIHDFLGVRRQENGEDAAEVFHFLAGNNTSRLGAEEFVSGLLRSKLQLGLQADEIEACFHFLDPTDTGFITVDAFLEFSRPVPAFFQAVVQKLRSKVNERRHLGLEPFQPFHRLDSTGSGKVTRRECKMALREWGFTLVDEPEPDVESPLRSSTAASLRMAPLADAEDDVLESDVHVASQLHRDEERRVKEERRIFQERIDEQYKRMERLAPSSQAFAMGESHADASLAEDPDAVELANERVEVSGVTMENGSARTLGLNAESDAASQEDEIGTLTHSDGRKDVESGHNRVDDAEKVQGDALHVVEAERELRRSLDKMKGVRPLPHFATTFLNLDAQVGTLSGPTGRCTRQQFLFALAQHGESLRLSGAAQRGLCRHFDVCLDAFVQNAGAPDDRAIDYRAFLRFVEFEAPSIPSGILAMREMHMPPRATSVFKEREMRTRSGYVSYEAFADCLRDLGYGHLSSATVAAIGRLFQLHRNSNQTGRGASDVNYVAFLAFVSEQPAQLAVINSEALLREKISSCLPSATEGDLGDDVMPALRAVFSKFSSAAQTGVCYVDDWCAGVQSLCGPRISAAMAERLFARLDPFSEGVSFGDFITYVRSGIPSATAADAASALDLVDIRKKLHLCMTAAQEEGSPSVAEVEKCFQHYDWRGSGRLDELCFGEACFFAGFTLTSADCRKLVDELGDGVSLPYGPFLKMATPPLLSTTKSNVLGDESHFEALESIRAALRTAQGAGAPLLEVFQSHESEPGVMSVGDLVEAMGVLGHSLVKREAKIVAEAYGDARGGILWQDFVDSAVEVQTSKSVPELLIHVRKEMVRLDPEASGLRVAFERKDLGNTGRIERGAFQRALAHIGVAIKPREALQLASAFAAGAQVAYREFLDALRLVSTTAPEALSYSYQLGTDRVPGTRTLSRFPTTTMERFADVLQAAIRKGIDYRFAFEHHDDKLTGFVSVSEFRSVLYALYSDLSDSEEDELLERFGDDAERVAYLELLYAVPPQTFCPGHPRSVWIGDNWRVEEHFRFLVRQRFDYWVPNGLRKAFYHFDVDKQGEFNEAKFAEGLRLLQRMGKLSTEQEHLLFRRMDLDGDDLVSYPDFVVFVRDPNHCDVARRLRKDLSRAEVPPEKIREMLEDEENTRGSIVSKRTFDKVMTDLGVTLTAQEIDRVVTRFSPDEDGAVSIRRVLAFMRGTTEGGDDAFPESLRKTRTLLDVEDDGGAAPPEQSDKIKQLLTDLKEIVESAQERGISTPAAIFDRFDKNKSGNVNVSELQRGLQSLDMDVSRGDARTLMQELSGEGGRLTYESFLSALNVEESVDASYKANLRVVLNLLISQGESISVALEQTVAAFEEADERKSGRMVPAKLRKCLKQVGVELTPELLVPIHAELDERNVGNLDYDKFLEDLRSEANTLEAALDTLKHSCKAPKLKHAMLAAGTAGEEGGRVINPEGLRSCLQSVGCVLKDEDFALVCDAFSSFPEMRGATVDVELLVRFVDGNAISLSDSPFESVGKYLKILKREVGLEALRDLIHKEDKRGKGTIKLRKFEDVLNRLGDYSGLSEARQDKLMRGLRKTMKEIDYEHMLDFMAHQDRTPKDGADEAFEKLKELIREAREERSIDLLQVFSAFDKDNSGAVDAAEFRKGLSEVGIVLTAEECRHLMAKFKGKRAGVVKYRDFTRAIDGSGVSKKVSGDTVDQKAEERRRRAKRRFQSLKDEIQREIRRAWKISHASLKRLFNEFDENGTGVVSRDEFQRGLRRLHMNLSSEDIRGIIDAFDEDGDGKISYAEFMHIAGFSDEAPAPQRIHSSFENLKDSVKKEIQRVLERERGSLKKVFARFDRDESGEISRAEFGRALQNLGLDMTETELYDLVEAFDADGNGKIDYREFMGIVNWSETQSSSKKSSRSFQSLKDTVRKEVRKLFDKSGGDLKDVFAEIDADATGAITRDEFRKVLRRFGLNVSDMDIYDLVDAFDSDNDGKIDYTEFMEIAGVQRRQVERHSRDDDDTLRSRTHRSFTRLKDALQTEVKRLLDRHGGNLKRTFAQMDESGRGQITRTQFRNALRDLRTNFTNADINELFDAFDTDGNGTLDYREFMEIAGVQPREDTGTSGFQKLKEHVQHELRKLVEHNSGSVKQLFADMDRDGSGRITREEFRRGLRELHIDLSSADVYDLVDAFDADSDGRIDYREFMQVVGVSLRGDSNVSGFQSLKEDVQKSLRRLVDRHGVGLKQLFADMDRDGSGTMPRLCLVLPRPADSASTGRITREEFRRGLRDLGMDLSTADLYDLVDAFDADSDGRIDYREFMEIAGVDVDHLRRRDRDRSSSRRRSDGDERSRSRRDTLDRSSSRRRSEEDDRSRSRRDTRGDSDAELRERIQRALRRQTREKGGSIAQAFGEFDRDGSGHVTRSEFKKGLRNLGLTLDDAEVFDLVERLDRDGDGRVSYREFKRFVGDY